MHQRAYNSLAVRPARSTNTGLLAIALLALFAGFSVIYVALFYDPTLPVENREGGGEGEALTADTVESVVVGNGDDVSGELGSTPVIGVDGVFKVPKIMEKEEGMDMNSLEQLDNDSR
ncbi:hypothetical protein HDU67_003830, partial [Dinochytrium kinnereticum]